MTAQNLNGHGESFVPRLGDPLLQQQDLIWLEIQWQPGKQSGSPRCRAQNRAHKQQYFQRLQQLRSSLEVRLIRRGCLNPEAEADRLLRAAFSAPSRRGH